MSVLGVEPGSSRSAASALNHQANSPAPIYIDAKDAMNVFSSVWAYFIIYLLIYKMKSGHSVSMEKTVNDT